MFELDIWHEWIAYTTRIRGTDSLELVVVRFPGGELRSQIPLHHPNTDIRDYTYLGDLDWSPDGELMVVSAARDGDDTDLYIFRKFGDYLERITTEAGQAHEPRWSPDGKLIIYKEFVESGCGQYIVNTREFNPETEENSIVDTHDLATRGCGGVGPPIYVEAFDTTGKFKATLCFYCHSGDVSWGVYIQGPEDEEPKLIYPETTYPYLSFSLQWDKLAQRFIVNWNDIWLVFNREGSIEFEVKDLQISPDQTMVALVDQYDILTIYELGNGLHKLWRVTDPPIVTKVLWIPNSNKILLQAWTHIYHLDVDKQTVNLVGRDLAVGFSIYDGYWVSQNP